MEKLNKKIKVIIGRTEKMLKFLS